MKKAFLSMLVCGAAAFSCASAEIIWVDGVNAEDGWFDANKTKASAMDDNLCYGASAANLIRWWQSKYQVPAGTPNTIDAVWKQYVDSCTDGSKGGDTAMAMQWWLTGVGSLNVGESSASEAADKTLYPYTLTYQIWDSNSQQYKIVEGDFPLARHDGYYMTQYNVPLYSDKYIDYDNWQWVEVGNGIYNFLGGGLDSDVTLAKISDAVTSGKGVSLSIKGDNTAGHAITLWGVETKTVGGEISKLWITDSDDAQYGLNPNGLFSVEVTQKDGKLYIDTPDSDWYAENSNTYIDGMYTIDPSVSLLWGMQLIPEPGTATLSLLALAGLAVRRRR